MNEFGIIAGLKGFVRPLDFTGRSTRTEAVALAVAYFAILLALYVSGTLFDWMRNGFGLPWVPLILFLYPWPAMLVRRAHDAGQPAWIAVVAIVFSATPLLIVWPGDDGPNQFGPNPRLSPDSPFPGSTGSPFTSSR